MVDVCAVVSRSTHQSRAVPVQHSSRAELFRKEQPSMSKYFLCRLKVDVDRRFLILLLALAQLQPATRTIYFEERPRRLDWCDFCQLARIRLSHCPNWRRPAATWMTIFRSVSLPPALSMQIVCLPLLSYYIDFDSILKALVLQLIRLCVVHSLMAMQPDLEVCWILWDLGGGGSGGCRCCGFCS